MKKCSKCDQEVQDGLKNCTNCGSEILSYLKPAGFWIRVVAYFIDGLVFIPIIVLSFIIFNSIKSYFLLIVLSIPGLIYKPFMESYYGATLGKMVKRLKVIDERGEKLDLKSAYIRFIPFLLATVVGLLGIYTLFSLPAFKTAPSMLEIGQLQQQNPLKPIETIINLFILVDCIAVAFTYRKRALHDMIAHSFCVYQ